MESEGVKSELEQYALLRRHVRRIREHPLWQQSHIVFIPENNLGLVSAVFFSKKKKKMLKLTCFFLYRKRHTCPVWWAISHA